MNRFGRLLLLSFAVSQVNASTDPCVVEWRNLQMERDNLEKEARIDKWMKIEKECEDRDFFRLRLIMLRNESRDYREVERLVKQAVESDSKYKKQALLEGIISSVREARGSEDNKSKTWNGIIRRFKELDEQYPGWWELYAELGSVYILLKEYEKAEASLKESLKLKPTRYAFSLLITCYYETGNYNAVVAAFNDLFKADNAVVRVEALMLMVIHAYTAIEDFDSAKEAVSALVDTNPEVVHSKKFREAVDLLKSKMHDESGAGP